MSEQGAGLDVDAQQLPGWRRVYSGKVRDLFRLDDDRLALVASDRISAFDVVMPTPIPDKGRVLTGLSRYWFGETASIVPNHLLTTRVDEPPELRDVGTIDELRGRFAIVIVTHSMQQAARVSQRTAFFHLGHLVEYGETSEIFTNPRETRTKDYITGRYG